MSGRLRAAFSMAPDMVDRFFGTHMERLRALVDVEPTVITDFSTVDEHALAGTDILITGWDAPRLDENVLDRMPNLHAVVHAAGSVKAHVAPAVWSRGILVSAAGSLNAVPVAEYTLAMMILAAKRALPLAGEYRRVREFIDVGRRSYEIGTNGMPVAVIGASATGMALLERLRILDLRPCVYDPYVDHATIARFGAQKVSLDEAMRCPIVSIHAPSTPETTRMISAPQLALMPDGGTLINTARGSLLDHEALLAEVRCGRLFAVLDVTDPEPLPAGHDFYDSPHVLLTPHIAGSHGNELARLGGAAVDEIERVVNGQSLMRAVDVDRLAVSA